MAIWDKSTFKELSTINSGNQLQNGDISVVNQVNCAIENTGYLKDQTDDLDERTTALEGKTLKNHAIELRYVRNVSSSDIRFISAFINLQDYSNTRLGSSITTLLTELQRIKNSYGSIMANTIPCTYYSRTGSSSTPTEVKGMGYLEFYDSYYIINDASGNVIFSSSGNASYCASYDTITSVRE